MINEELIVDNFAGGGASAGEEDNGSHCPWNQEIHSG